MHISLTVAMVSRITLSLKSHDWEKTLANSTELKLDSLLFAGERSPAHRHPKPGDAFSLSPSLLSTTTLPYRAEGPPGAPSDSIGRLKTVNDYLSFGIVKAHSELEACDDDNTAAVCTRSLPEVMPALGEDRRHE